MKFESITLEVELDQSNINRYAKKIYPITKITFNKFIEEKSVDFNLDDVVNISELITLYANLYKEQIKALKEKNS